MTKKKSVSAKKKTLLEIFMKHWKHFHKPELTGIYGSKKQKNDIQDALAFWSIIRSMHRDIASEYFKIHKDHNQETFRKEKNELLKKFMVGGTKHTRLIACMELLSTVALRKALWFYNINFESPEACLRRINRKQVAGIKRTYKALNSASPMLPECFTLGWKNKIRQMFRFSRFTLEDVLSDKIMSDKRYAPKGTIAYEFFDIDFGFNAYPSESNDKRTLTEKLKVFLKTWEAAKYAVTSDKTEGDEFIVNQEFGAYWFFYRTMRSNYVWFPNRDVQLKTAICPGFWYTLIAWSFVLFVSPAFAIISVVSYFADVSLWFVIPEVVVGMLTPLILFALLMKSVFVFIGRILLKSLEKTEINLDKKFWKDVGEALFVIFIASIAVLMMITVFKGSLLWFYGDSSWLIYILSTYLTAAAFLYVVYMIHKGKPMWPTELPIIGIPTIIFLFGKILLEYHTHMLAVLKWIWEIVAIVVSWLASEITALFVMIFEVAISFAVNNTELLLYLSLIVAVLYLSGRLLLSFEDSRDKYYNDEALYESSLIRHKGASKALKYFAVVFLGAILVLFGYSVFTSFQAVDSVFMAKAFMVLGSIFVIEIALIYLLAHFFNPEKGYERSRLKRSLMEGISILGGHESFFREFSKNTWLAGSKDGAKKVQLLFAFARDHFQDLDGNFLIDSVPDKLYQIDEIGFIAIEDFVKNKDSYIGSCDKGVTLEKAFELMFKGMKYPDACARIIEHQGRYKAIKNGIFAIMSFISVAFVFLFTPVMAVYRFFKKVKEDTGLLLEIFHKKCPGVATLKNLW